MLNYEIKQSYLKISDRKLLKLRQNYGDISIVGIWRAYQISYQMHRYHPLYPTHYLYPTDYLDHSHQSLDHDQSYQFDQCLYLHHPAGPDSGWDWLRDALVYMHRHACF